MKVLPTRRRSSARDQLELAAEPLGLRLVPASELEAAIAVLPVATGAFESGAHARPAPARRRAAAVRRKRLWDLGEDELSETVAGLREGERDVGVQALELASGCASRRCPRRATHRCRPPSSPPRARGARAVARAVAASRSARSSGLVATAALHRSTPPAASSRETRGDEVRAREVVRGRERRAFGVVGLLLGHGRKAVGAACGDPTERPGAPADLALDGVAIVHARRRLYGVGGRVTALPGGDALDDEEPLAGLDVADPPRLAGESGVAPRALEPALEACLLGAERHDLRAPRAELAPRLQVARDRPVVEERHHDEDGDREQDAEAAPLAARLALRRAPVLLR